MKKIFCLLLTLILTNATAYCNEIETKQISELYMHIGSPLTLANGEITMLDSSNPNIAPIILDKFTFVPLRAVSEHFKADVSFDDAKQTATIKTGNKTASFPVGENYFVLNDKKVLLETSTQVIDGRVFVPLRIVCENILDMKVDYNENIISVSNIETKLNDDKVLEVSEKIGAVLKISSIEQLKSIIETEDTNKVFASSDVDFKLNESSRAELNVSNSIADTSSASKEASIDFSTTNVQVQGIDEGDIIKTNGENIYIASSNKIAIVSAKNGQMEVKGSITLSENNNISELYIDNNSIVVIGNRYEFQNYDNDLNYKKIAPDFHGYYRKKVFSFVNVYNINTTELIKSYEIEGNLTSSRKKDNYIYIISNYYIYEDNILPMYLDTTSQVKNQTIDLNNIMYMPNKSSTNYVTVSVISTNPSEKTESLSILSSGHNTYMNENSLYITEYSYGNEVKTNIIKFNIDKNKIVYSASGSVNGNILNQFSLDEYNNHLRIATTGNGANNLYILDKNLNIVGSINDLAKGERIYAIRFMGDKGYMVTFRQIDPLFTFDLSNPTNPKVLGELKIPGFSNYLHPVYENILLGIGYDTEEIYKKDKFGNEVVVSTVQGGIKLSLFDVSDMSKPTEIDNIVLGSSGSHTEATYNHKAIMYKLSEGLVGFTGYINDYSKDSTINTFDGAVLIEMSPSGFVSEDRFSVDKNLNTSGEFYNKRLIYIDNVLYYINNSMLISYDIETKDMISNLSLGFK